MSPSESPHDGRVLPGLSNAELVEELRATRCQGRPWITASALLADTGLRTLCAMARDGRLNCKLGRLLPGRYVLRPDELARVHEWGPDAVVDGLDKFRRDTIAGEGWTPRRDAGQASADLGTWVINTIILQIPDVLRSERAETRHRDHETPWAPETLPDLADDRRRRFDGPDELVDALDCAATLSELVLTMPPDLAEVIRMEVETDLTRAECCRELGKSERAIEGQLRRWRKKHGRTGRHRRPEEPT